jgi:hypothetical protein
MTAELQGNLSGKRIFTHTSSLHWSDNEISQFMRNFNAFETNFKICNLSNQLFKREGICHFQDVPFHDTILCEAIILTIKYANLNGGIVPSDSALKTILQICLGIEEDTLQAIESPKGKMMKLAYDQFTSQENPHNTIGRMWHVLNSSWNSVENQRVNPIEEIEIITGIPYKGALYYGLAFASDKQGSIVEYGSDIVENLERAFQIGLAPDSHNKFLKWISCTKSEFTKNEPIPAYIRYPVLNSELTPAGCASPVFFAPSPNNIISRVSTGIYFDLIDKFKSEDGRSNPFKTEYGYAFEKYVGEILHEYLKSFDISPEIEFGPKKSRVKSVDYFALKNGNLILIEVKQSSIAAPAKFSGDIDDISAALKTNTEKAVKQLKLTEGQLTTATELAKYSECKEIVKIVVMADPLYNANNLIKSILKENNEIDSGDIHFMNITDFEDLLDAQEESQSLYEIMQNKTLQYPDLDFKEYIQIIYRGIEKKRKIQTKNFNEVFPDTPIA